MRSLTPSRNNNNKNGKGFRSNRMHDTTTQLNVSYSYRSIAYKWSPTQWQNVSNVCLYVAERLRYLLAVWNRSIVNKSITFVLTSFWTFHLIPLLSLAFFGKLYTGTYTMQKMHGPIGWVMKGWSISPKRFSLIFDCDQHCKGWLDLARFENFAN